MVQNQETSTAKTHDAVHVRTALIFGISGQDGGYLSRLLLGKGYKVHGTSRHREVSTFANLQKLNILQNVELHVVAIIDFQDVRQTIRTVAPNEIYYLAGQSSVGLSFDEPVETIDSNVKGLLNVLEAIKLDRKDVKVFFASSGECFGCTDEAGADDQSPFRPSSPYAVAKAAAQWLISNYREAYGIFACSGILFNHESPLRPSRYVTKKIIRTAVAVSRGERSVLELGTLAIARDWGWAPEYVEAMWLMLQQTDPTDLVIATGVLHTLRDFVAAAFGSLDLDWERYTITNPSLARPIDPARSVGNPARAKAILGWTPDISMQELVSRLVQAEIQNRYF